MPIENSFKLNQFDCVAYWLYSKLIQFQFKVDAKITGISLYLQGGIDFNGLHLLSEISFQLIDFIRH